MVKDIDVLWDVILVICMIYGSMRDMEVKDSKSTRLQPLEKLQRLYFKMKDFVREGYGDVFRHLEIEVVRQVYLLNMESEIMSIIE